MGPSNARSQPSSHMVSQRRNVWVTNHRFISTLLLKLAWRRSATSTGGTRKMRQISSTLNCRDSSHCASSLLMDSCAYFRPFSRMAVLPVRSEEHTSELQSLMRISYAVFCLKKKHRHYLQNTIIR